LKSTRGKTACLRHSKQKFEKRGKHYSAPAALPKRKKGRPRKGGRGAQPSAGRKREATHPALVLAKNFFRLAVKGEDANRGREINVSRVGGRRRTRQVKGAL